MIVFYSIYDEQGTRKHAYIKWMADVILATDISYWAVPGTLED